MEACERLPHFVSHVTTENFSGKIQLICNGKCAPITMQSFARALEKPPAQEQWQAMKKTMRGTIENSRKSGRCALTPGFVANKLGDASAAVPRTRNGTARRREAPGADFRH